MLVEPINVVVLEPITAALPPGMTQVVWQCAAAELHDIMQFVTVEVTVLVSGMTGCDCCCAKAAPERTADNKKAETADAIVTRMMLLPTLAPKP